MSGSIAPGFGCATSPLDSASADDALLDEAFRDLDRVERRTLAKVVTRQEQAEPVLDCVVYPNTTDIGRIDTGRVERRGRTADSWRNRTVHILQRRSGRVLDVALHGVVEVDVHLVGE